MFWLNAKKLEGDDLVNAVKALQGQGTRKERNDAFENLRDTFGGLITNKVKSVSSLASNKKEYDEIRHHIETSFLEALMRMEPRSAGEIVNYIKSAFATKINIHSIKELLGKDEIISDVKNYKIRFKNALRTFYQKYKHMPDFNKVDLEDEDEEEYKSEDLKNFAEIIKMDEDKVLEVLKMFGSDTVKSMSSQIAGEGEDNVLTLMDTLSSNTPLPDEVLKDREIMRVFKKEIKKLPENEQKVLMEYYHPDKPEAEDITSDELAKKLQKEDPAYTERMVRHWIAIGREKLRESPELKELYTAGLIKNLVKFAMSKYVIKTAETMIYEIVTAAKTQEYSVMGSTPGDGGVVSGTSFDDAFAQFFVLTGEAGTKNEILTEIKKRPGKKISDTEYQYGDYEVKLVGNKSSSKKVKAEGPKKLSKDELINKVRYIFEAIHKGKESDFKDLKGETENLSDTSTDYSIEGKVSKSFLNREDSFKNYTSDEIEKEIKNNFFHGAGSQYSRGRVSLNKNEFDDPKDEFVSFEIYYETGLDV